MSKVVVVGCGAMGSVYAGLMQLAGHDVHGVCLWPDHVEAVNAHGLRVHGASGDHTVRLASMTTSTGGIGVRACWRTDPGFGGTAVARMKKIMAVGGVSRRA
jgi:Ketopantoate reductase PanE/ApbA